MGSRSWLRIRTVVNDIDTQFKRTEIASNLPSHVNEFHVVGSAAALCLSRKGVNREGVQAGKLAHWLIGLTSMRRCRDTGLANLCFSDAECTAPHHTTLQLRINQPKISRRCKKGHEIVDRNLLRDPDCVYIVLCPFALVREPPSRR